MSISIVNKYIQLFSDSLQSLGARPELGELERLSILVHRSMEQSRRVYHNSDHVFGLCEGMNPIQTLAALFHDVVYVQLDDGFASWTTDWLAPLVSFRGGQYFLNEGFEADPNIRMCTGLFGFVPRQELSPFTGLNEFLSAVVAVRALGGYLDQKALLAIVVCIEATVPFRGSDSDAFALAKDLRAKTLSVAKQLNLGLSDAEVLAIIKDAMVLANADVAGFAFDDPGRFLSDTWMLIDESNAPLAKVGLYTLGDYRQALQRMAGFLQFLDYRKIFHAESENDPMYAVRQAAAQRNLDFSVRYLNAKLTGVVIVEELARMTGGDAPISMFLGDIRGQNPIRIEHFLKARPDVLPELDPFMMDLLENGRRQASRNDTAASPMTAFLYRWLGEPGMAAAGEMAQQLHAGQITSLEFLRTLPIEPVQEIILGCAQISLSRSALLRQVSLQLTS